MERYNPLEREGVNALEKIILKDFKWIFREQPIVDVGIDVLIEESLLGNPSGKFLAVQIKSGQSNYYDNGKELTYYLSDVHYHYWINLDLPIILVLYDPAKEHLYWKEISQKNVQSTPKGRKLAIPKTHVLNYKSLKDVKKVIYSFKHKGLFWEKDLTLSNNNLFEYVDNIVKIEYLTDSINYINNYLTDFQVHMNNRNGKFAELLSRGLTIASFEVNAVLKGFSSIVNITSIRLFNETKIFSEINADSIIAYRYVILQNYKIQGKSVLGKTIEMIRDVDDLIKAFDVGLNGIKIMLSSFEKIPETLDFLKIAKDNMILTLNAMILNFSDAKNLWIQFFEEIKKYLQK